MRSAVQVEIADTRMGNKLVKIIKNGRVYAAHYAEPFPTKESALRDYINHPRDFVPFDESTNSYIYN